MKIADVEKKFGDYTPLYLFTYGMLTDPRYMKGSEFIGVGSMTNHKFAFYHWADVVDYPGSNVSGVLWRIPMKHIDWLDKNEGTAIGLYTRKTKPVIVDGQRYESMVYQMTPKTRRDFNKPTVRMPTKKYLSTLVRGYQAYGVDTTQIKQALTDLRKNIP